MPVTTQETFRHLVRDIPRPFIAVLLICGPALICVLFGAIIPSYALRSRLLTPAAVSDSIPVPPGVPKDLLPQFNRLYSEGNDTLVDWIYYRNLLSMADSDSVAIAIDLRDSVVCVYIKGVCVRRAVIDAYNSNAAYRAFARSPRFASWLTSPFSIESWTGSIPKELRYVRTAPKDTIEAARTAFTPDTQLQQPVRFLLRLTNGIDIDFTQIPGTGKVSLRNLAGSAAYYAREYARDISGVFRKHEVYRPFRIRIALSRTDARAIYRSLSTHTLVALRP